MYGLEHSNGGLITFAGGVPLINKAGQFIGAIGVSGGPVLQVGDSMLGCQNTVTVLNVQDLVVAKAAAMTYV